MTLPICVGLGWRPETAWLIDSRRRTRFSEAIAENIDPKRPPRALAAAIERGLSVVTHGVSLDLGGAEPPDRSRVRRLAAVAKTLRSPLVSEHVAFSRAGTVEASHFLPVPRTKTQLAILVDHVRRVIDALEVPFALENVAAPLAWPDDQLAEAEFLAELVDRSGALLLLDVANLLANLHNHGGDAARYLDQLPCDRIAYLHAAGGARVGEMWRDTHAHPIAPPGMALLEQVLARTGPRPILVERDHAFGTRAALESELDAVEAVLAATRPVDAPPRSVPPPASLAVAAADRARLASSHRELVRSVIDPEVAPPPGFAPVHIEETRAILRLKQDRKHAH